MIMKNIQVIFLMIFVSAYGKIPDYIHKCAKKDPAIDNCIIQSINGLRALLKDGIPELDVPSIEPFHLQQTLKLKIGARGTNITDINAWGASQFKLLELRSNLEKYEFRYKVVIPDLLLKGLYEVDTNILVLVIQGKGPITIKIKNYKFDCLMKANEIKKKNVTHLKFEKMQCEIGFDGASINMENLFNGNQLLGNATNNAINDNVDIFFNEVKPKIVDELSTIFTNVANKITLTFPADELFL